MFTGIIEAIGVVKAIEKSSLNGKISINAFSNEIDFKLGDSVSTNGLCLTVVSFINGKDGKDGFTADVSRESFKCSTLGSLSVGESVNIETALTQLKPMGGHMVTGHIDCVGTLKARKNNGELLEFSLPVEFIGQIVTKGSIAINGISLTIAELTENGFKVAVIPHTFSETTLSGLRPGAMVNIETDIIGKYVERSLEQHKGKETSPITESFLMEHGFMGKN